jgi:hypothetical protein
MCPGIVSAASSCQHLQVVIQAEDMALNILTHIQMQMTSRPLFALKYRGLSEG